jgi:hypothetical protein
MGKLNFVTCYTAISSVKYFLKPQICESVRELNPTSCYWLKSVNVWRCVFNMSNLETATLCNSGLRQPLLNRSGAAIAFRCFRFAFQHSFRSHYSSRFIHATHSATLVCRLLNHFKRGDATFFIIIHDLCFPACIIFIE